MSVIVDAEDYFRHARSAMLKARKRIMLIGWDFDARIRLIHDGEREPGEPETVGDFLYWLVERTPGLELFLLRWDVGALKTLLRGTNVVTIAHWMMHKRIHTKLDSFHPPAGSHHQKIVVIDDALGFCGGIDMTSERWDTRCHRDGDPGRTTPAGEPYKPWHDVTTALEGPVAAALGTLARDRWKRAGGHKIMPVRASGDCWPDGLEPQFSDVEVGIARTRPDMPGCRAVHEIEDLFVAQIRAAKTAIYAESQYFASRRIAEAIAARLDEVDGPEIVIVNPESAQGWLEPIAMDTARARLVAALRRHDRHGRFRIYHPYTADGAPIYVHAKVMIVDGRTLRIGSANMNNRSLGLDTECDVSIDPGGAGADTICEIRDDLIAEHLGVKAAVVTAEIARRGSLIGAIEALAKKSAAKGGNTLRPYEIPELNEVEAWLAENEVLDAEGPGAMFEGMTNGGLLRKLRGK
ncbi:phospholipase [Sphingomonas sp. AP4-R1]|uniref:phospholipase D-like domain-containing protein n=1 Tax=Sphingomonas sp. AP4-R1 TaxID=2735134 RepID=UPI0014935BDA|nr:phospholipase D-like domain-containing protein [Sphingomonas sp. AP4-R1]QJU58838.1 phospholipase [Sphingomonas sp. AP4-R1]